MATIIANEQLAPDIYRLTAAGCFNEVPVPGQFYMLRCWGLYPVLSRPISIHDAGPGTLTFLFRVHGTGTSQLAALSPGDPIEVEGPLGMGFPEPQGRTALVGGGLGIAPLLYAAKRWPQAKVFLGYSGVPFASDAFRQHCEEVQIVIGGTVADAIQTDDWDTIYACGPVPLMERLWQMAQGTRTRLYISVEKRMACGVGACCGCTVKVSGANQRACVEGPVFLASEVNFDDLHHL